MLVLTVVLLGIQVRDEDLSSEMYLDFLLKKADAIREGKHTATDTVAPSVRLALC